MSFPANRSFRRILMLGALLGLPAWVGTADAFAVTEADAIMALDDAVTAYEAFVSELSEGWIATSSEPPDRASLSRRIESLELEARSLRSRGPNAEEARRLRYGLRELRRALRGLVRDDFRWAAREAGRSVEHLPQEASR